MNKETIVITIYLICVVSYMYLIWRNHKQTRKMLSKLQEANGNRHKENEEFRRQLKRLHFHQWKCHKIETYFMEKIFEAGRGQDFIEELRKEALERPDPTDDLLNSINWDDEDN